MKLSSKASSFLALTGILSLVLGILVLVYPGLTLVTLAFILGVGILCTGIVQLSGYITNKEMLTKPGWTLVVALLDIFIGIFLLANLGGAAMAIPFVVGFWAMFVSITKIAASASFRELGFKNWWVVLISGFLGLILSFFIMFCPTFGALVVIVYIGVYLIFVGITDIAEAFYVSKLN
ncbi:Uncharacterized conserved protein [Elusimicrobium minutum Pei191]|uniref:Uncharacterized conserved protein n=1 Tax=Elusimicrobium minutum (strain Pei191) TaxID=445932 RepID=B2KBY7_ELUMP|nr:DUF308 domain-containing protein [Elusimicrobium minutum]ACC97891.1 Uncharacterized conserved protein [Elusimicrobium minutum Pei191]